PELRKERAAGVAECAAGRADHQRRTEYVSTVEARPGGVHQKRFREIRSAISQLNKMNAFDVIKTARLTEKGTRQGEKLNQYTLVADPRANKFEIKRAVEELFKVKVLRVNTMNMPGKL